MHRFDYVVRWRLPGLACQEATIRVLGSVVSIHPVITITSAAEALQLACLLAKLPSYRPRRTTLGNLGSRTAGLRLLAPRIAVHGGRSIMEGQLPSIQRRVAVAERISWRPHLALIDLTDVSKTYDLGEVQVRALAGVSLTINRGEYVSLIGPSGSGKSTLLNTLGCLDRPTGGSYKLAGEEVVSMTTYQRTNLRNQHIGFVFQNFNLLARTSAFENVELPLLYCRHVTAKERRSRVRDLLQKIGLADRMDHHPGQLSGGQQQRVAIARALVNEPSILLADEPTGNLDSSTSHDVMQTLQRLNKEHGLSIILVTHDLEVARNADRCVVLHDGLVVADTTDFDLASRELHEAGRAVAAANRDNA